jgi:hypothetical protein
MTNKEFKNLKCEIQQKMIELAKLQATYRKETGRYYTVGGMVISRNLQQNQTQAVQEHRKTHV